MAAIVESFELSSSSPLHRIRPATSVEKKDKKVFVTQLNDREEEDASEANSRATSASYNEKNKTKSRQIQQTVLLKYRVHEDEVNKALLDKRRAFQQRMKTCKDKQDELSQKQQETEQRMKQFESYINEKEAKRKRAITRYQLELKIKLQKKLEHDILLTQLSEVKSKHLELQGRLERAKLFKDYLSEVIDLLPDNYLEAGESKFTSLIYRYQTLHESNHDLFDNLISISDKLRALRLEYEHLIIQHNSNKMTINSKLGELRQIRDQLSSKNSQMEEDLTKNGEKYRKQTIELADIFIGIDNLAEKCMTRYAIPLKDMSLTDKLERIQHYINEKAIIHKMVKANVTEEEFQQSSMRYLED